MRLQKMIFILLANMCFISLSSWSNNNLSGYDEADHLSMEDLLNDDDQMPFNEDSIGNMLLLPSFTNALDGLSDRQLDALYFGIEDDGMTRNNDYQNSILDTLRAEIPQDDKTREMATQNQRDSPVMQLRGRALRTSIESDFPPIVMKESPVLDEQPMPIPALVWDSADAPTTFPAYFAQPPELPTAEHNAELPFTKTKNEKRRSRHFGNYVDHDAKGVEIEGQWVSFTN